MSWHKRVNDVVTLGTYELNAYTDQPQRIVQIYSLLHQNIQDSFNKGGVEIMSPHYTQVRDGNKVTIPASYLPQDYVPGALRIQQIRNAPKRNRKHQSDPLERAKTKHVEFIRK
jgi:hypothetical protein